MIDVNLGIIPSKPYKDEKTVIGSWFDFIKIWGIYKMSSFFGSGSLQKFWCTSI